MRNSGLLRRNFNSQPHEEADGKTTVGLFKFMCISTHSLTRRLTVKLCLFGSTIHISTHSLTRRLTIHLGLCP